MRHPRSLLSLVPLALLTSIPACAVTSDDAAEESGRIATRSHAIEIGTDDTSSVVRDAVGRIFVSGGMCTGTLVAPDKILTAAHCAFDTTLANGQWRRNPTGAMTFRFGPQVATSVIAATGNYATMPNKTAAGHLEDIAVVHLTDMVPNDLAVPRAVAFTPPAGLSATSAIYEIGYGGSRDRRIMRGTNYRASSTPNQFTFTPDVTGPGIGDRNTNIEGGDSGGPILFGSDTGPVIGDLNWWDPIGVKTYGTGDGTFVNVRDWLRGHLEEAPSFGWVFAHVATGSYDAETVFSYGALGRPRIDQLGTGRYEVRFRGEGRNETASFFAQAYGGDNVYCKLEQGGRSVGEDLLARVACFTPAGVPANSRFVLSFVKQHQIEGVGQGNVRTSGSGASVASEWSSTGRRSSLTRLGTGFYKIALPGQTDHWFGNIQVTASGANANRCKVDGWWMSGSSMDVRVRCHTASGAATDADFEMQYVGSRTAHRGRGAFAHVSDFTSASSVPPFTYAFHSEGLEPRATASPTVQSVTFPSLPSAPAVPQITAYGASANYCKIVNWLVSSVTLRCFDTTGTVTASPFNASYLVR